MEGHVVEGRHGEDDARVAWCGWSISEETQHEQKGGVKAPPVEAETSIPMMLGQKRKIFSVGGEAGCSECFLSSLLEAAPLPLRICCVSSSEEVCASRPLPALRRA